MHSNVQNFPKYLFHSQGQLVTMSDTSEVRRNWNICATVLMPSYKSCKSLSGADLNVAVAKQDFKYLSLQLRTTSRLLKCTTKWKELPKETRNFETERNTKKEAKGSI